MSARTSSLGLAPAPQLGLFGRERAIAMDETFGAGRRVALDEASWVDHFSGWLKGHEVLFEELARLPGWEQRKRWMFTDSVEEPRLTATYPSIDEVPNAIVQRIAALLSKQYAARFDRPWMNLYRDHHDSTGWHADRPANKLDRAVIPVLSLGETRRFLVRPRDGGSSVSFTAVGGDLIVMGGRCQRDWVHGVPKETRAAGARISVNFGSSAYAKLV